MSWRRSILYMVHREVMAMRKFLLSAVTCLAMVVWAVPLEAHADSATVVVCGQTLTHDTRLANDLVNCPANGLIIGADHITVDLGGHSVDGVNAAGSEGVSDDGHGGLHIRNGVITDFFLNGVGLRNAPHSTVRNLTIRRIGDGGVDGNTSAGVLVKDSPESTVTGNTVMNDVSAFQSDGVDVLSSPGVLVAHNRLAHNAWNGMFVLDSPRSRVLGNRLDHNQNQGTEVNAGSDSVLIAGNVASNNVADGIVVGALKHARVQSNTFLANGDTGLFLFDLVDSDVTGDSSAGNSVGIVLAAGQNGSTGNRIANNTSSRNLFAGIVLDHAAGNAVVANVANANHGQPGEGGGIVIVGASGNTVTNNIANHNLDVGVGVFEDEPGDSAGNRLARNKANANGAHGMDAVDGSIDGGGNIAHHNTPLPNCLGVVCS
jgi:parallel beta-helix repeat protein